MRATKRQEVRRRYAMAGGLFLGGVLLGVALAGLLVPPPESPRSTSLADAIVELRLQVHYLNASLELFLLEYGDALKDPSELPGAQEHLTRAERIYSKVRADLSLLDSNATARVGQGLTELRAGMDDRRSVAELRPITAEIGRTLDGIVDSIGQ